MEDKYIWHYNDKEYMEFAKKNVKMFMENFNYKSYITPYNETRELVGRIIEEFQSLECCIANLLYYAIEFGIYKGKVKFDFDNYISATKIIKNLQGVLIEDKIAKQLINLVKIRNYIVHKHFVSENKKQAEKEFPNFLFMIYETVDYISNVTNRIIGGATHIPNIFEINPKTINN